LLDIDTLDSNHSEENPGIPLSSETLYGIFYTSGSTGKPKGVIENHRNMLYHVMAYTNAVHVCADDRLTLLHSLSFRASEMHLFGALLNGAALFPLDLNDLGMRNLAAWLNEEGMTIYHSIPAVFRELAYSLTGKPATSTLRLIHLSGAASTRREVDLYKQHFGPRCLLLNRMGFTEGYTIRWYFIDHTTQIAGNRVPVGYPVEETRVLLIDEAGKESGPEEIGEIAVKSRYLVPGYWRRPDLTRAAFLPDPAGGSERIYRTGDMGRVRSDGCLEHVERKDFQVKIRGHRVDLGEIESTLNNHAGIKEAVVAARPDPAGELRLVAYIVPAQTPAPANSELRRFLRDILPDYMIPSALVRLDAFPLTPNGKLDYRALPAPETLRPEMEADYVAPRTDIERLVAIIWQDVLGLEKVGLHDNFFDLGGNSLLLAQVHSKLQEQFEKSIPILEMFGNPTIGALSKYLNAQRDESSSPRHTVGDVRQGRNRLKQLSLHRQRDGQS
jgi:acyl-coenzyme A synthetase/AMP-(fatty) acid ligase/acyl carrier protein